MLKEWQLENHFFLSPVNWLQKRSAVNKIIRWKISGKLFNGGESCVILSQVDLWGHYSRVPWTARRSSQSILKEINPEYSLKGPMLKLKFQYFGYLIWRADSLEKTLRLGKVEGGRRRGQQDEMVGWHHWLNGHEFEQAPRESAGHRSLVCYSPWGFRVRHNWATEQQSRYRRVPSQGSLALLLCYYLFQDILLSTDCALAVCSLLRIWWMLTGDSCPVELTIQVTSTLAVCAGWACWCRHQGLSIVTSPPLQGPLRGSPV